MASSKDEAALAQADVRVLRQHSWLESQQFAARKLDDAGGAIDIPPWHCIAGFAV